MEGKLDLKRREVGGGHVKLYNPLMTDDLLDKYEMNSISIIHCSRFTNKRRFW